jgi:hypothetical protein
MFGWLNSKRTAPRIVTLAAMFICAAHANAATIVVNGSDDTIHAGNCSLRAAIATMNSASLQGACSNTGAAFGSGDLITFASGITTITLNDAAANSLLVSVNNLVIQGNVVVERNTGSTNAFRVITHTGNGTLTLSGLTIRGGLTTASGELGAGIRSNGTVSLLNAVVENNITNCATGCNGGGIAAASVSASNTGINNNQVRGAGASGGGIWSTGLVEITTSDMSGNRVDAGGCGGAVFVGGDIASRLRVISSYVGGNRAQDSSGVGTGSGGNGGALCVIDGSGDILNSEIRGNEALGEGGAVFATSTLTVEQSSFNGNFALRGGGALRLGATTTGHQIRNSTLYFNRAGLATINSGNGGAILTTNDVTINNSTLASNRATGLGGAIMHNGGTISMTSTIVADSTSENPANGSATLDIYRNSGTATISGSNNLIQSALNITVPAGTLTGNPLLGALSDLGCLAPAGFSGSSIGCPRAMLPGAGSPAINAGANPLALTTDQRGSGYARVIGGQADIGAIETSAAVTAWPINVTIAGVTAGSGGVSCAPNPVPNGSNANCIAGTPNPGYVFVGFSGACTGLTCTLTNVTAAQNVTATFALAPTANASQPVPTLSQWLAALLAFVLMLSAALTLKNRS